MICVSGRRFSSAVSGAGVNFLVQGEGQEGVDLEAQHDQEDGEPAEEQPAPPALQAEGGHERHPKAPQQRHHPGVADRSGVREGVDHGEDPAQGDEEEEDDHRVEQRFAQEISDMLAPWLRVTDWRISFQHITVTEPRRTITL